MIPCTRVQGILFGVYNECLLPKRNIILQHIIYYNFTTDGGAALQQIYNTCIVIPKNDIKSTVFLLHNTSTIILHYILI